MLNIAKDVGFEIPTTYILKNNSLLNKEEVYFTKPISEVHYSSIARHSSVSLSNTIYDHNEFIENDTFFYSLFQNYIDKEYEIRVVYFLGLIVAVSIHSQSNENTKYDFRNYDENRPNRYIPLQLPKEINDQIHQLMKTAELKTGSIDLIYTKAGKYVFLEVNPVGIIDFVSGNSGIDIEKMISQKLIEVNNDRYNKKRIPLFI